MMWSDRPLSNESLIKLLHLTAFEYTSSIWWREDDEGRLRMFVNCSDFFAWGGSDLEEVDEGGFPSLIEAVEESEALLGRYNGDDGFLLWVARRRGKRPQGAYYEHLAPELWPMFDACGPAKQVGLGNPRPHPDDV